MKRIFLSLLSLVLFLSLAACKKESYTDHAATSELSDSALRGLRDGVTYLKADSGYLDDYFKTPDYVTDSEIRFARETGNLNELGIYHVPSDKVSETKALLEGYLRESLQRNQGWYDSYIPQETPKLRDAEVRVFGNYVTYAILDAEDRATVFESIRANLTQSNK